VPVRGHADMARRGVHHIRFLPRIIQPRAGYHERHDQPVPAALSDTERTAQQCRESATEFSDVSRAYATRGTRERTL
jgi:hypothetical protein